MKFALFHEMTPVRVNQHGSKSKSFEGMLKRRVGLGINVEGKNVVEDTSQ